MEYLKDRYQDMMLRNEVTLLCLYNRICLNVVNNCVYKEIIMTPPKK